MGLIVAALLLAANHRKDSLMTDEEIIARAESLGMVMDDSGVMLAGVESETEEASVDALSGSIEESATEESENEETASPGEASDAEAQEASTESTSAKESEIAKESEAADSSDVSQESVASDESTQDTELTQESEASAETAEDGDQYLQPTGDTVTLSVHSGDSSVSVARRAYDLGLVSSATAFDQYLCQNGYDKKIRVGNYTVTVGMSENEIARLITN